MRKIKKRKRSPFMERIRRMKRLRKMKRRKSSPFMERLRKWKKNKNKRKKSHKKSKKLQSAGQAQQVLKSPSLKEE